MLKKDQHMKYALECKTKELNKYILNYPGRKTSGSGKGDFAIELRLEDVEKRSAYEICLRV